MPQPGARAAVPMPPYRDAPTVAQAPVTSSIPAGVSPRELALHLIGETDAATARQTLLQIASLSDTHTSVATHSEANTTRLTLDIPLATDQGTAVAQFRIERDGTQRGQSNTAVTWRANFSINLEPIGPLHVRIALTGGRTAVTLNAERAASASHLAAGLPLLEAGLRGAALEPGDLRCQAGSPRSPAAAPGQFVDHAT